MTRNLKVIDGQPKDIRPQPPGKLGNVGLSLWTDIISAYEFADRGSYELLFQACVTADRAASLREAIDRDGELLRSKTGIRDHPLLKHEIAARAFLVRTLSKLGLDLEPLHDRPGRPSGR